MAPKHLFEYPGTLILSHNLLTINTDYCEDIHHETYKIRVEFRAVLEHDFVKKSFTQRLGRLPCPLSAPLSRAEGSAHIMLEYFNWEARFSFYWEEGIGVEIIRIENPPEEINEALEDDGYYRVGRAQVREERDPGDDDKNIAVFE